MELSQIPVFGLLLLSFGVLISHQAAPTFTNLPDAGENVDENTAVSTAFFTASAVDSDGDAITYMLSSSASSGTAFFSINSGTGVVSVKSDLDYETIPATAYTLTVTAVANGESVAATLVVNIVDVAEGLTIDSDGYGISIADGQTSGTYLPDPGITVTDLDNGDTFTCTMECPPTSQGRFTMVRSTCTIYFTEDYSVDFGDASEVTCTLTVTDSTGNTATGSSIYISITDSNNYTPQFTQASYNFYVGYLDAIGTEVAPVGPSIEAIDYDTGTYGNIQYSLDQTSLPSPYNFFRINPTTGALYTIRELSACSCSGVALTFTVIATDDGDLSSSASITVNVDTSTTTVTTTTLRYLTLLEDPEGVAWLCICILLGVFILCAGIYLFYKYCCNSCIRLCRRSYSNLRPDYEPGQQRFDTPNYKPRYNRTTQHTPI